MPATLLRLIVRAVCDTPALWGPDQAREHGLTPNRVRVDWLVPDSAIFDLWIETPGTGWYEMCLMAGLPDYDGTHPAWAAELDTCWLSWDQTCNSLRARLLSHD